MNKLLLALIFVGTSNFCNSQSLDQDIIYATQFGSDIYLNNQLNTRVKMRGNSIINIVESNDDNQVTRELLKLSDTTFLYTEYFPLNCENYLKHSGNYGVIKEGVLVISYETMIDSTVMWDPGTFETLPSPRERQIFKPTGIWFEVYKHFDRNYRVTGSFNSNGKHGKWKYFTNRRSLDKTLTFENGTLIKEEFVNILNYKSIEKTRNLIQRTWACSSWNTLSFNHTEHTSTYTFKPDGTFTNGGKKGTWLLRDYKTIEYTMHDGKRTLNLEYVRDDYVRFTGEIN